MVRELSAVATPAGFLEVRLGPLTQLLLQLVLADCTALDFNVQVHFRWGCQTEGLCHLGKINRVDIENLSLLVGGVGLEVGSVAVLG